MQSVSYLKSGGVSSCCSGAAHTVEDSLRVFSGSSFENSGNCLQQGLTAHVEGKAAAPSPETMWDQLNAAAAALGPAVPQMQVRHNVQGAQVPVLPF